MACKKNQVVQPINSKLSERLPLRLIYFDTLQSTNLWCEENLDTLVNHYGLSPGLGVRVSASKQTKGIGQTIAWPLDPEGSTTHRTWIHGDGNLYVTFVFIYPSEKIQHITALPLLGAFATVKTLQKYDVYAEIKWPNDIVVNGKKISGILCRWKPLNGLNLNNMGALMIGIGLNVKTSPYIDMKSHQFYKPLHPTCLHDVILTQHGLRCTETQNESVCRCSARISAASVEHVLETLTHVLYENLEVWKKHEFLWSIPDLHKFIFGYEKLMKFQILNESDVTQTIVARLSGVDSTAGGLHIVEQDTGRHITLLPGRLLTMEPVCPNSIVSPK